MSKKVRVKKYKRSNGSWVKSHDSKRKSAEYHDTFIRDLIIGTSSLIGCYYCFSQLQPGGSLYWAIFPAIVSSYVLYTSFKD